MIPNIKDFEGHKKYRNISKVFYQCIPRFMLYFPFFDHELKSYQTKHLLCASRKKIKTLDPFKCKLQSVRLIKSFVNADNSM